MLKKWLTVPLFTLQLSFIGLAFYLPYQIPEGLFTQVPGVALAALAAPSIVAYLLLAVLPSLILYRIQD